jgi:uncharacterized damage-inducible protein DinB
MTDLLRDLPIPPGYRSREAALFVAQMDDQSRRLKVRTRDLTPEELAWQSQPGMNTIGMLLAHIAIVEADWMQTGPLGRTSFDALGVLGINEDDDGMPLADDAGPPQILAGRDLAFFDDLLARARDFTRLHATPLTDSDLDRRVERIQDDGSRDIFTVRWVLYHMLEHLAGHFGQILLLRHTFRVAGKKR